MVSISQKINISSLQVLKTLQILMQGDYSMNELIELLNENEQEPIFNNSVISKYINTCRYCGIEIPKIYNKYCVSSVPFGMNLTTKEVDLLKATQTFVNDEMSARSSSLMDSLVEKISRFSSREIVRVQKQEFSFSVELFERAIAKRKKVKLLFKNQYTLECVPISVTNENKKLFFNVYDKRIRNIEASRLSAVEISGRRFIDPFGGEQVVLFKLYNPLAKRYEARPNESVTINSDGTILVQNRNENLEMLYSRLLRYDDKCEIVQPKWCRDDMKDMINKMLENYGE